MKTDIKWINTNKVRKTLCNISFSEDLVYPAHTKKNPGFTPYVPKRVLDEALAEIKDLETKLRNRNN